MSASESSSSLGRPGAAAGKKKVFAKGTKTLKLAVYADAPREPELVGEAVFDLAKALNSGEDEGASRAVRFLTAFMLTIVLYLARRRVDHAQP